MPTHLSREIGIYKDNIIEFIYLHLISVLFLHLFTDI